MAQNGTESGAATAFRFYEYNPNFAAACAFVAVFAVSALVHIWQLLSRCTWYFIPFVIGCFFEAIGYVGRAMSAKEAPDFTKNPYIIQSILLLLGPTLFAASIYMVLGRLIVLLQAEKYSLIRIRWLTKVFVLGDVLSFLAQGGGGGMLATATDPDSIQRGQNIILGGLGIQIVFFGFFMVVTLVFHLRLSSRPTARTYSLTTPWRQLLVVLYASSMFIMLRSAFRVAEYIEATGKELKSKEIYIYLLDALLMALTAVLYNVFHPSRVISKSGDLTQIPSAEVLGEGYLLETGVNEYRPHRKP